MTISPNDQIAKRNAVILSIAQSLYGIMAAIIMTVGSLVGNMLAEDKSNATLPITTFILGSLVTTIPASFLMGRIGRRGGFLIGITLGVIGNGLAVHAIYERNFALFCTAMALCGSYQSFAHYYRFAAADGASESLRPKVISWVLVGGVASAILGPEIIKNTKDALAPVLFAGCFVASACVTLLGYIVLACLVVPKEQPLNTQHQSEARPLSVILKQPRLQLAILSGVISYAVMSFVMTATPLAMVGYCNFSVDQAAGAIQWHIVAMFAPSFFTGSLIARFGQERVILAGTLILFACAFVAMSGIALSQFYGAMILLGVGWNFGFVGATSLVAECHRPEERTKIQALNDFIVFGFVALASFLSGKILKAYGWDAVNMMILPLLMFSLILLAGSQVVRRKHPKIT